MFAFYLSGKVINSKNDLKILLFVRCLMIPEFQFKFLWNLWGWLNICSHCCSRKIYMQSAEYETPK